MTVSKIDGFKISMSGSARQIVLLCHGGWSAAIFKRGKKSGDGYTFVPAGTTLHFYTAHGTYTSGLKTAAAILTEQANSFGGLKLNVPDPRNLAFSIQCKESKGGAASVQIYNYSLSIDDSKDSDNLWINHTKGQYESDVDLIMVDTKKPRNLSDAFEACKSAHGSYYAVMHYCPCRYVEDSDKVSMLSMG
jgi:hypothetical protein